MAVKLIANYAKRLGLPGYSSHQFSVCIETELVNVEQVQAESSRLYKLLQESVDEQILETGFVPPDGYGMNGTQNGNGSKGHTPSETPSISDKQLELIKKVVRERNLDKEDVEQQARSLFGCGVRQLNRMQASNLIDELLDQPARGNSNGNGGKLQRGRS